VKKRLIICADDFGLSASVNEAIIELIKTQRINATSCMTSLPGWKLGAARLRDALGTAQAGLHLTLTDQESLAPLPQLAPNGILPPYKVLLEKALWGRLDRLEILDEFQRQFDAFQDQFGAPPHFVDGHHHIQQLPTVRDAVIELVSKNDPDRKIWIRNCWEPVSALLKRQVAIGHALSIGLMGPALIRRARQLQIPTNTGFTGVYNYTSTLMDKILVRRLLRQTTDGTLMMCHPGLIDEELRRRDTLTDAREVEYRFFKSDAYLDVLNESGGELM
jgi:predicted glycoside hydrolase/deacetylase ChbG (UPF0249 family)